MDLPAICQELRLRPEAGVPVVNSRHVAEFFEKRHDHVLRDIEQLASPDLGALKWFRAAEYIDEQGKARPSYDLTRQGFTLLAMGWTGDRAMNFKVRYIQAFDEMEAALKGEVPPVANLIISGLKEALLPLAVRFDDQDRAIDRVEDIALRTERRVDGLAEDMAAVKVRLLNGRKLLTAATKREHISACIAFGGKCPCCGEAPVIIENQRSSFADYDHFYTNSRADADHTWLICKPCHNGLTSGRVPRHEREAEFRAYQAKRLRLPGRQPRLF
jgi:Rha family phage regulatory protein